MVEAARTFWEQRDGFRRQIDTLSAGSLALLHA
jgi:hypothetical protein